MEIENATTDFFDGVKLINLIELLTKQDIKQRYNKAPKNQIQQRENCNIAIDFLIKEQKMKLVGIGSDNIQEKDLKRTLGLVFLLIMKYSVEEISVEEATARDALLIWCKKNTQGYNGVNITNFTNSWQNGLGFCALINRFRPDILDFNALDPSDHIGTATKAFDACKTLGIAALLDAEDICDKTPDEKSVITQCSEFFHFFAAQSKNQTMADKIKRTVKIQKDIEELSSNYEAEAREALELMQKTQDDHNNKNYEQLVQPIKNKLKSVIQYGQIERPQIMEKRSKALRTYGALLTKCKSTNRPVPAIPQGLEPEVLTTRLEEVDKNAVEKINIIKAELRVAEDALVAAFDAKCKVITDDLQQIIKDADSASGTIEEQQDVLNQCTERIKPNLERQTELKEPYQELTNFRLEHKTLETLDTIQGEIKQDQAHIDLLNDRLEHERLVREFNQACIRITKELTEFLHAADSAKGTLEEQEAILNDCTDRLKKLLDEHAQLHGLYDKLIQFHVQHKTILTYQGLLEHIQQAQNHINQLLVQLSHEKLVRQFNQDCTRITEELKTILHEGDHAHGTIEEQQEILKTCTARLNVLENDHKNLADIYNELTGYNLNYKTLLTHDGMGEEIKQAEKHIDLLNTKLRHELMVRTFNENTNKIDEDLKEVLNAADHAQGTIEEQQEIQKANMTSLENLLKQQSNLIESYNELTALYLHHKTLKTIDAVKDEIVQAQAHVKLLIERLHHELLVRTFNQNVDKIVKDNTETLEKADAAKGAIEEQYSILNTSRDHLKELLVQTNNLTADYQQLIDLHQNHKATLPLNTLKEEVEQAQAHIQLLFNRLDRDAKIDGYNKKAVEKVNQVSQAEATLHHMEGTLDQKRAFLQERQKEADTKREQVSEIVPDYQALEAEDLHLDIDHTPSSIGQLYEVLSAHIHSLLNEVDAAIAAEKGLQIDEALVQEYRQTFETFDRDKTRTLQYYELKACLTAMGENFSDDQCKDTIKKYTSLNPPTQLDFDGYVKFMTDLLSKAETPESTKEAFTALAAGANTITDEQINTYFPPEDGDYLKAKLPPAENGYNFNDWATSLYTH